MADKQFGSERTEPVFGASVAQSGIDRLVVAIPKDRIDDNLSVALQNIDAALAELPEESTGRPTAVQAMSSAFVVGVWDSAQGIGHALSPLPDKRWEAIWSAKLAEAEREDNGSPIMIRLRQTLGKLVELSDRDNIVGDQALAVLLCTMFLEELGSEYSQPPRPSRDERLKQLYEFRAPPVDGLSVLIALTGATDRFAERVVEKVLDGLGISRPTLIAFQRVGQHLLAAY